MRSSGALAVVAALGLAAAPAGATVRTAPYAWTPATGPVAAYQLFLSIDGEPEESFGYVGQPSVVIQLESGSEVVLRVAAVDASGRAGPQSDPSSPLRLCPGDFDGDEEIEYSDLSQAQGCFQKEATGACAAGDLNNDGTVGFSDLRDLVVGADACEVFADVGGCLGDMDGDGEISAADVFSMRSCLGLYAQGNCSDADFDGNGYVTNTDIILANREIGAVCSN